MNPWTIAIDNLKRLPVDTRLTCEHCKQQFVPARFANRQQRFCSYDCCVASRNARRSADRAEKREVPVKKTCGWCGEVLPAGKKWCSPLHRSKYVAMKGKQ